MHRNTGKFLGIKFTMVFFLKVQRDKMKPACPSVYTGLPRKGSPHKASAPGHWKSCVEGSLKTRTSSLIKFHSSSKEVIKPSSLQTCAAFPQ